MEEKNLAGSKFSEQEKEKYLLNKKVEKSKQSEENECQFLQNVLDNRDFYGVTVHTNDHTEYNLENAKITDSWIAGYDIEDDTLNLPRTLKMFPIGSLRLIKVIRDMDE